MAKDTQKPTAPMPGPVSETVTYHPSILALIPDEYLAAIGRITAAWALLDALLDMALWHASQSPQMLGACVTSQIFGTPGRIKALGALYRVHQMPQKAISFLNKFEVDTHAIAIKRNRAVHDAIAVGRKTGQVYRMTAVVDSKKQLVFGMTPSTPKALREALDEITRHVERFGDFWSETGTELESLRTTTPLLLQQIVPAPTQSVRKPSRAKPQRQRQSSPAKARKGKGGRKKK